MKYSIGNKLISVVNYKNQMLKMLKIISYLASYLFKARKYYSHLSYATEGWIIVADLEQPSAKIIYEWFIS